MKKKVIGAITFIAVIIIIFGSIWVINQRGQETSGDIAKCIGQKSVVYTQLGCHACTTQEGLFGESYQYINKVDCFYSQNACIEENITATPTWVINGEKYVGVQSIEELKELTGC